MTNKILFFCLLASAGVVQSAGINQRVANAYNEGIVRCSNAECASYLYACFRSFSESSLDEFLACGSQASRLNGNEFVVARTDQSVDNTDSE